jgi:hypothetical protein
MDLSYSEVAPVSGKEKGRHFLFYLFYSTINVAELAVSFLSCRGVNYISASILFTNNRKRSKLTTLSLP